MLTVNPISSTNDISFKKYNLHLSDAEIEQLAEAMVKSTPKDIVEHASGYGMKQLYKTPESIIRLVLKKMSEGKFDYLQGFFKAFNEESNKDEELSNIDKFIKESPYIKLNPDFVEPVGQDDSKLSLRQRFVNAWKALKGVN